MPRRSASSYVTGHSWFFGIGIDAYAEFPPLHNAVKDMTEVHEVLIEKYDVTEEYSSTLTNAQATEENIILELERLAGEIGENDKLLIYYSGHGHMNSNTNLAYWIPVDARLSRSSDFISNSTIRDHLSSIQARHILLISDSCFSGSLFLRGGTRSTRATEELARTPSRWALCSGRGNEEVEDGLPGENSPFARSVIDALNENTNDVWNVSKLVERVREQTAASATQVPEGNPLRLHGHKGGQYVFRSESEATTHSRVNVQKTTDSSDTRHHVKYSQGSSRNKNSTKTISRIAIGTLGLVLLVIIAFQFLQPPVDTANISVSTFHTTSSVNENVWPADQRSRFTVGDRVYVYGLVVTDLDTKVEIHWINSNNKVVDDERKEVIASTTDPFRLSTYKIFKDPGVYIVELSDTQKKSIARDTFRVIEKQ